VHKNITSIFGQKKVRLSDTNRAVTPFGGLAVFFEFLNRIGFVETIEKAFPFKLISPNAIPPAETFVAFIISVLTGARRFAHSSIIRMDQVLKKLTGICRFPGDDTIRNLFKRFSQGNVYRFYSWVWLWLLKRIPERINGYSLDLDSTVFERYGHQEGALKGHNPKKHGRPSHHPLLAILEEASFVLHAWLRSGNCHSSRGVVEFLKEALSMLSEKLSIRVVRADSGFFDKEFLQFLEKQNLLYIVVAKMTQWLKREAARIKEWKQLDEWYAVSEFKLQLFGWDKSRRFVVIREKLQEKKDCLGRKLFDIPGYTFRIFVTNRIDMPEEIWRDYNLRAGMEKRIAELKYDLAADSFCMKEFFPTEAAFLAIILLFNLLSEFQKAIDLKQYKQPATLRNQIFLCGAILGRAGHDAVIFLSSSWGGLKQRNHLFDNLLHYINPTSPKFEAVVPV
jgi:hypothetical protein